MEDGYEDMAKVANVIDKFKFVINRASQEGVSVGQNYLIFYRGENVFDPDTNEDLGSLEIVRGRARVVHVQERIATLESSEQRTTPGKVRRVSRDRGLGLLSFGQPSKEVIEEGEETHQKRISAERGDFARPV